MDLFKITLSLFSFFALPLSALADLSFSSPGPLSTTHQKWDGPNHCESCHEKGKKETTTKCLACHTEIQIRIERKKGFHGRIPPEIQVCGKCHPEHAGREFKLIDWGEGGKNGFDHDAVGYPLKGGHRNVSCNSCHRLEFIKDRRVRKLFDASPQRETYLGVSQKCVSCHFDEHRGLVKKSCEKCHGDFQWKNSKGFNHQKTAYPLTGKHVSVSCAKCHPLLTDETTPLNAFPPPKHRTYLQMKGFPFSSCENCHDDVHEGKFGKNCKSCHTTESWSSNRMGPGNQKDRQFHEKTKFPLRGAHTLVPCTSCHGSKLGSKAKFKGIHFDKCANCHYDAHFGQFSKSKWPDCTPCHDVRAFIPVNYGVTEHAKTRYPLEGGHRAVACIRCHERKLDLRSALNTEFQKNLKRLKRPSLLSRAIFRFKKPLQNCESCHVDPHFGEFNRNGPKKKCTVCHTIQAFEKLNFDHNKDSRYPLTGKHAQVSCSGCHPKQKNGSVKYRAISTRCDDCHQDIHFGQFRAKNRAISVCESCHTTEDFKKNLKFNHNDKRYSAFPLEGKHEKVKCDRCHLPVLTVEGKKIYKYINIPMTCDACHVDPHKGAFKKFEP